MDLPVRIKNIRMVKPRLEVYYPQVEDLPNRNVQISINNAIYSLVKQLIEEQGYYQNPRTEVTGTFEIKNNQRGILSLSIINYAYSGGAHGLTFIRSLTIDVETGRIYNLRDLFTPGSDYVKRLSEIIALQIKERDITLLEDEFKGIRPNQDFYIADKSLVIYFQQYEIAAYVYGLLHFPISVYEIQDIIDEEGPLGKMLY